jgi:hypothetical protein
MTDLETTANEILNDYSKFYTEDYGVVEDRNVFILWDHIAMQPIAVFSSGLYSKYRALAYKMLDGETSLFNISAGHALELQSINALDGVQMDQCKDLVIGLSNDGYRLDVVRTTKIATLAEWETITHFHPH